MLKYSPVLYEPFFPTNLHVLKSLKLFFLTSTTASNKLHNRIDFENTFWTSLKVVFYVDSVNNLLCSFADKIQECFLQELLHRGSQVVTKLKSLVCS